MNSINLVGRAGGDAEIKYHDSGSATAKFNLAVDRGRKDKDGNKLTDWFTVKSFGKTAEVVAEYVKKGKQVAVTGAMVNDKYQKDGQPRDYWQVNADRVVLLGSAQEGNGASKAPSGTAKGSAAAAVDEELPF